MYNSQFVNASLNSNPTINDYSDSLLQSISQPILDPPSNPIVAASSNVATPSIHDMFLHNVSNSRVLSDFYQTVPIVPTPYDIHLNNLVGTTANFPEGAAHKNPVHNPVHESPVPNDGHDIVTNHPHPLPSAIQQLNESTNQGLNEQNNVKFDSAQHKVYNTSHNALPELQYEKEVLPCLDQQNSIVGVEITDADSPLNCNFPQLPLIDIDRYLQNDNVEKRDRVVSTMLHTAVQHSAHQYTDTCAHISPMGVNSTPFDRSVPGAATQSIKFCENKIQNSKNGTHINFGTPTGSAVGDAQRLDDEFHEELDAESTPNVESNNPISRASNQYAVPVEGLLGASLFVQGNPTPGEDARNLDEQDLGFTHNASYNSQPSTTYCPKYDPHSSSNPLNMEAIMTVTKSNLANNQESMETPSHQFMNQFSSNLGEGNSSHLDFPNHNSHVKNVKCLLDDLNRRFKVYCEANNSDSKIHKEFQEWYLKQGTTCFGIRFPEVEKIVSKWVFDNSLDDFDEVKDKVLIRELFRSKWMENKYAGIYYMHIYLKREEKYSLSLLDEIEELFREDLVKPWNISNSLAIKNLRLLIKQFGHPAINRIVEWTNSKNMWQARTPVVTLIEYPRVIGRLSYYAIVWDACSKIIARPEDMAKISVGALMRQFSLKDMNATKYFIEMHIDHFNIDVMKNATTNFKPQEREAYCARVRKRRI